MLHLSGSCLKSKYTNRWNINKRKAMKYAKELGVTYFTVSDGWFGRWQKKDET